MANYYYVKNGGSAAGASLDAADGIYSTQKTGTWASAFSAGTEYFDTLGDAMKSVYGAPTDGDYIICSDAHNASYDNAGGIAVNQLGASDNTGSGLIIVSVDDTDITAYSPGASDVLSDFGDDYTYYNSGLVAGVSMGCGGDVTQVSGNARWRFQDLTLSPAGSGRTALKLQQSGSHFVFSNVDINFNNAGCELCDQIATGCNFEWRGGAFTGTAITALTTSAAMGNNGGCTIKFTGVDLSNYQGPLSYFGLSAGADTVLWRYENCKLHASATLGTPDAWTHRIEVFGGWGGSDQHGFAIKDWTGVAEHDDAVYVTADEAWYEGSTISSIKIVTTANCSHLKPFVIEMPGQYVDFGAASDVLSLECVSATSGLQSNDIAAFMTYPDAASAVTPNWVTSGKTVGAGNYGIDPLSTSGNALDAGALGAGDWTGEPASSPVPTFYKLELDTTGDPGSAGAISIRIEVYKPSLTIYISPQIRTA